MLSVNPRFADDSLRTDMFGWGKIGRGGLGSVNKQDPREGWQTLNLFVLALAELRGFAAMAIDLGHLFQDMRSSQACPRRYSN